MIGKNQKILGFVFLALCACERNEPASNDLSKISSEVDTASQTTSTPQNEPVPFEAQEVAVDSTEAHGLEADSARGALASDSNPGQKEGVPSVTSEIKTHSSAHKDAEKPAFLARECASQNEGEMGFNSREKRAYFCNGSQWVRLSKKFLKDQRISGVNLETMHDKSFLCQKSETGGFRCMKAATYKNAH